MAGILRCLPGLLALQPSVKVGLAAQGSCAPIEPLASKISRLEHDFPLCLRSLAYGLITPKLILGTTRIQLLLGWGRAVGGQASA